MATHFLPLSKNVSWTSIAQGIHLCQILPSTSDSLGWSSSRRKYDFPHLWQWICRYHGNTLTTTVKKCVLHIYTQRQTSVLAFHENWWKTEEVVRDARFFPNFRHNMELPWLHTVYHFQKMCLAHLYPKAIICAKLHENWLKNWGSSPRRKIFPQCQRHNMPLP